MRRVRITNFDEEDENLDECSVANELFEGKIVTGWVTGGNPVDNIHNEQSVTSAATLLPWVLCLNCLLNFNHTQSASARSRNLPNKQFRLSFISLSCCLVTRRLQLSSSASIDCEILFKVCDHQQDWEGILLRLERLLWTLTTRALLHHHVLQIAFEHDVVLFQVDHANRRELLRTAALCDDLGKFVSQRRVQISCVA